MPYDPNIPATNAEATSAMFRGQFNGLKDLIDALQNITQAEVAAVNTLPPGDPAVASVTLLNNGSLQFSFGIPQGMTGETGATGQNGTDGQNGQNGMDGQPGQQGPPGEVSLQQLADAIATTSGNSNGVDVLSLNVSDPPTQGEMQTLVNKVDELIQALRR